MSPSAPNSQRIIDNLKNNHLEPEHEYVCVLRKEFADLTGETNSALLLNQLFFWTDRLPNTRGRQDELQKMRIEEIKRLEQIVTPGQPSLDPKWGFIYNRGSNWKADTHITKSERTLRRYLNKMEENGFLFIKREEGKNNHYRLDFITLLCCSAELGLTLPVSSFENLGSIVNALKARASEFEFPANFPRNPPPTPGQYDRPHAYSVRHTQNYLEHTKGSTQFEALSDLDIGRGNENASPPRRSETNNLDSIVDTTTLGDSINLPDDDDVVVREQLYRAFQGNLDATLTKERKEFGNTVPKGFTRDVDGTPSEKARKLLQVERRVMYEAWRSSLNVDSDTLPANLLRGVRNDLASRCDDYLPTTQTENAVSSPTNHAEPARITATFVMLRLATYAAGMKREAEAIRAHLEAIRTLSARDILELRSGSTVPDRFYMSQGDSETAEQALRDSYRGRISPHSLVHLATEACQLGEVEKHHYMLFHGLIKCIQGGEGILKKDLLCDALASNGRHGLGAVLCKLLSELEPDRLDAVSRFFNKSLYALTQEAREDSPSEAVAPLKEALEKAVPLAIKLRSRQS